MYPDFFTRRATIYEELLANASWALEVCDVSDVVFVGVACFSVINGHLIKGDTRAARADIQLSKSGLLFVNGVFSRNIYIEEPPSLPIRRGLGDIELTSSEPLSHIILQKSEWLAVILPPTACSAASAEH